MTSPSPHRLKPIEFEGIERQAWILNYTSACTYESEMICFDPSDESMHGQEQISMRAEVWTGEEGGACEAVTAAGVGTCLFLLIILHTCQGDLRCSKGGGTV